MSRLSVVLPAYNEELMVGKTCRVLHEVLAEAGISYELVVVDDGSKDKTWEEITKAGEKDGNVLGVHFSRNFGKEAAMYAGLQNATGDYVVLMDADLQHPPEMLNEMYHAIAAEGYDIAAARRVSRKGEPMIRSFFARMFYKIINKISKAQFVDGASDFRMLSRAAVNALLEMKEYNRFSKGIFGWIGFKTKWIPYENVERVAGETKWSFWKLLLYSLEGFVAFSTAALSIASVMGIVFCLIAFVWMVWIIIKTVVWGETVAGFPTLACLILLIGGSIQLSLGIIGQYLAKTYLETKHRPIYIVAETNEDYHEDTTI